MAGEDEEALVKKKGGKTTADRPVSSWQMFALSSTNELIVLAVGVFAALLAGLGMPGMGYINAESMGEGAKLAQGISDGTKTEEDAMALIVQLAQRLAGICVLWFVAFTVQLSCLRVYKVLQKARIRVLYFRAILHQDMSWFDARSIAALPTQMADTVEQIADAYGDKFGFSFMAVFACVVSFGLGFYKGWQVATAMLTVLPFIIVTQMWGLKLVAAVHAALQEHFAQASETVEESLFAVKTVLSLGLEKQSLDRFEKAMEIVRRGGVRTAVKKGVVFGASWLFQLLSYAVCFGFGGMMIKDGRTNPSTGNEYNAVDILVVFVCINTAGQVMSAIDPGIRGFHRARIVARGVFDLLNNDHLINCVGEDDRKTLTHIQHIKMQDVHFAYPQAPHLPILQGISLTIQHRQKVAFVGSSGCGKSTMIALLERFYDPTDGQVLLNGEDIRSFTTRSLRKVFGFVGQEPVLFHGTIRDNLLQGKANASEDEMQKALQKSECTFIKKLPEGIDTTTGSGGGKLSGGQKQRIAIARALLKAPEVLLLDEATSALDNKSEQAVLETFNSLQHAGSGVTMISVAHRLSTIKDNDCIYMFVKGLIQESGSFRELMQLGGSFYALAESQTYEEFGNENSDDEEEGSGGLNRMESKDFDEPAPKNTSSNSKTPGSCSPVKEDSKKKLKDKKKEKVSFARLMSYNKPEWWAFPITCIGATIQGSIFPWIGILQIEASGHFPNPDKEAMWRGVRSIVIAYGAFGVGSFIAIFLQYSCAGFLVEAMVKRLRMAMFTQLLSQEVGFHDDPEHSAAAMGYGLQVWTYRMSADCEAIPSNLSALASMFVGGVLAFYYEWRVAIVMLCCFPLTIVGALIGMMLALSMADPPLSPEAQELVSESVQNPKTIQSLCIEEDVLERFEVVLKENSMPIPKMIKKAIPAAMAGSFGGTVFGFITCFNLWWMAWTSKQGWTTLLDNFKAFMALVWAGNGIALAGNAVADSSGSKVAAINLFNLLDIKPQINGLNPDGITPPAGFDSGHIEFHDVYFAYPFRSEVQILKGMSFEVKSGQSVALVGPSGGGKSTIYAMLQRFYDPQRGSVVVGQQKMNLKVINIRFWREQIGFVGQEPILFNTTVRQNINNGVLGDATVSQEMLDKLLLSAHLGFLFENGGAGWETEVGPKGSRLSGGQKQRVAIARALARDPKILLLDEATSALDNNSEKIVTLALERSRVGRTSFSIAHRLSTVEDCDLILVAGEGVILEYGSDGDLMVKDGVYANLQRIQGKEMCCCA